MNFKCFLTLYIILNKYEIENKPKNKIYLKFNVYYFVYIIDLYIIYYFFIHLQVLYDTRTSLPSNFRIKAHRAFKLARMFVN